MGLYQKYCVCLYDYSGKLLGHTCYSCLGCAKKRMAKTTPACVREGSTEGEILYKNKYFEKIEGKI